MRIHLGIWTLIYLSLLSGCADFKEIGREYGRQAVTDFRRRLGMPDSGLTRIQRFNRAFEQEDYAEALRAAQDEIATPEKSSANHLIAIRLLGIRAMERYAVQVGLTSSMDHEVVNWYRQALELTKGKDEKRAKLYNYMQGYYGNTNRPGVAITFTLRELAIWEKHKNPYYTFVAYDNLWTLYSIMGELPTAERYKKAADELAEKIFNLNNFKRPKGSDGEGGEDSEWLSYSGFLERLLTSLVPGPGSVDEAFSIFSRYERVRQRKIIPKYLTYFTFAEVLITLGEPKMGQDYFKRGEHMLMGELANKTATESGFVCRSIPIYMRLHQFQEARQAISRCRELDPAVARTIAFQRYAGLTYEESGELNEAAHALQASVDRCDQARRTFALNERATFFNNACRLSSFAYIRVLARRYLASRAKEDFTAALHATERLRARQFGEVLESRQGQPLPAPEIETVQQVLNQSELLLDYVLTDEEIIIFAITHDRFDVLIEPYDAKKTAGLIRELVAALSNPGQQLHTSIARQRLAEVSNHTLAPVQDWLSDKTRLTVLPDGLLYQIPFDLLFSGTDPSQMLVESKSLRIAPSLRYLVWARREAPPLPGKGLLALADPAYTNQPQLPGLTLSELPAATRSSVLLRYAAPLPETRTEVESIAALFGSSIVRVLLGKEARESALKQLDLRPYRFVHIATHGIADNSLPGLNEPALLLSSEPREDGLFTVSEAEQLKLRAELTVLSACSTGVGKLYTGEGIMGLSRAFLLAGSRSVLVSLWPVSSKTTAEFMVDFYRRLFEGSEASDALRQTKLMMLRSTSTARQLGMGNVPAASVQRQDPFYWAPFVLVGP